MTERRWQELAPPAVRLVPGAALLRRYRRDWLRPDLLAGLTVGAMLVPQSMGYAGLAGMPPQTGLYAAIGALGVYALVGSSRHLGVGPEPGTAVLAAAGVAGVAGSGPEHDVELMAALALLVAVVCLLGTVLRLGRLASLLSRPVLVGYITGVGVTLLSSQLGPLTGIPITADDVLPRIGELLTSLDEVNGPTLAIGLGGVAAMLVGRRVAPMVPAALVVVVVSTVVSVALDLEARGVAVVGEIPAGLPAPAWPGVGLDEVVQLLPAAGSIALIGFADNVLTGRAIARGRGYRIDAHQELFALGAINAAAGLAQGMPVSSSASRSAVPAALGSRTQLVSIVGAASLVATLLLFRPALAEVPRAALAAVIVTAALLIIDVAGFRGLWAVSRIEAALAMVTAAAVILAGVLPGVAVAIGLSLALALSRIARPHDALLGDVPGLEGWVDVGEFPEASLTEGLVVFRFDAPLVFLNIERFAARVEQALVDNEGEEEWLVLDFEGIGALDATAIEGLRDLLDRLVDADLRVVAVARANDRVRSALRVAGLLAPEGPLRDFPTINSAVHAFRTREQ